MNPDRGPSGNYSRQYPVTIMCDSVGDGSGTTNAAGADYSGSGAYFERQAEPAVVGAPPSLFVHGLILQLGWSNAATTFDPAQFGDLAALANGVSLVVGDAANEYPLTFPTLKSNADIIALASRFDYVNNVLAGEHQIRARFDLAHEIMLNYSTLYYCGMWLEDDFTLLSYLRLSIVGHAQY